MVEADATTRLDRLPDVALADLISTFADGKPAMAAPADDGAARDTRPT